MYLKIGKETILEKLELFFFETITEIVISLFFYLIFDAIDIFFIIWFKYLKTYLFLILIVFSIIINNFKILIIY